MSKVNYSSIVTGDGRLFVGPGLTTGSYAAFDADITTNGENSVFYAGATQNGVAMGWTPTMVDIEVDQLGDAARVIVNKVQVMVKTTLAEATLQNLAIAWNFNYVAGANAAGLVVSGTGAVPQSGLATTAITAGATSQFNIGVPSTYAKERFIRINGVAAGTTSDSNVNYRTYRNTRAISYNASEFNMQRSDNQKYAVEFRVLPDTQYTGKEYGYICDSTLSPYSGFTI